MAQAGPAGAAIMRRLAASPSTGEAVRLSLAMDRSAFDRDSARLWEAHALRGRLEDGCCNAPCGPHCVSAFRSERIWALTEHGERWIAQNGGG